MSCIRLHARVHAKSCARTCKEAQESHSSDGCRQQEGVSEVEHCEPRAKEALLQPMAENWKAHSTQLHRESKTSEWHVVRQAKDSMIAIVDSHLASAQGLRVHTHCFAQEVLLG